EYWPRSRSPMTFDNFYKRYQYSRAKGEETKNAVDEALTQIGTQMNAWAQTDPDAKELFKCIKAECTPDSPYSCPQSEIRNERDWLPSAPSYKTLPKDCVCLQWTVRK
ncbi:MAG TPA: hypothetical protein VN030_10770, partial [Cellvibrio sp.]|nr:hypothetical protein [Cellvibrio sp.]